MRGICSRFLCSLANRVFFPSRRFFYFPRWWRYRSKPPNLLRETWIQAGNFGRSETQTNPA
jgi:hypothetical protein